TATELNEIGEKKIRIADSQGRRIYPSNKLNKVKKLLSFLKEQYGEYRIIEDAMGYKWAQFELTPDIVNSMEMLWGFPGPLGQAASRSFVNLIDRITGTAGRAGLLTRLGLNQPVRRDHMLSDRDAFNKIMKLTYGLTNIALENPHIAGLAKYVEEVRQFWNTKTFWQAKADGTLKEIQKLSGEMQDKVFRFALKVTVMSDRLHRRLNTEELERLNNDPALQLDDQALEAFERIDQDMRDALEQLYEVLVAERRRAFRSNPVAAQEAIRKLNENFDKLRNRHFFPLTRFGDHYVMTKTTQDRTIDGVQYKAGDVIELRTFEGVGATIRQKAYYTLHKQFEDQRHVSVSAGKFAEAVRATIGLPPQAVEMLERQVELTPEQKDLLAELVTQLSPATSFMKHLLERQATPGFSMDGMRGYAEYFLKFSNYIARETHKSALNDYLNDVGKSAVGIRNEGGDSTKRDHIYTWMQEHLKYLFDPGNEAANWRAGAFIWYLGFVPKSAYINLTQPILVTYPYLAAKYGHIGSGDIKAALGLSQAYMDTAGSGISAVLSRVFRDVSQDVVTANRIEPWLQEMIAKGVQENFLDESFATELAAISEGSLISRSTGYKTGRYVRTVGRWASYLFQQAERVNRRVAFVAAARLAFINIARGRDWADLSGVERNLIYKEARDAIEATQYEYARWNRPEMMRGPVKATLFTFFQYLTNTLFFATRMPGRGRFLLMLMLTAGLMGLPGADDLTKFLDALFTAFPQLRKFFGLSEKPMTDLQLEMRQYFAELTDRDTADLIMHGFGREYGLGPIHLLSLAGLPVPHTDVSGSIGMGRIIPGVPSFVKALSVNQDFSSAFTAFAQDAVGASFAVPLMILEALANPGPDVFKTV
ncbi:MAG: PLxRFG domain-containing protein, partial [bacterium]